jgi:integrase
MACLTELDAFKTLLKFLRERQGGKPTKAILCVAMTLKSIARAKEKLGAEHVARMARICANYNVEPADLGRNQERLKAFEDENMLAAILHLPEQLLTALAKNKISSKSRKTVAQVAIALEIELHSPYRLANLTSLCLQSNVQRVTVRGQPNWIVRLPGTETKNHKLLVFELPPKAVHFIERAMKFYDQPNGFLFPGEKGLTPKDSGSFGRQIKAIAEKHLGVPFNVHMMRGLVASMQVKENSFEHARAILGDSSDRVVRRHYTATAEQHLIRKAQDTIQRARTKTAPLARVSGKRKKAA